MSRTWQPSPPLPEVAKLKEVIVRLVGGLGNQMFQYAAARAVSVRLGAPLRLDLSWFGTDPDRQFALGFFNIHADTLAKHEVRPAGAGLSARIARRVRRQLGLMQGSMHVFAEKSFRYDPDIEKVTTPKFLVGHFQSEKYFLSVRDKLAQEFTLRARPNQQTLDVLERIDSTDSICLHIRRGDYVSNPSANAYHGTCSLDYYRTGLAVASDGLDRPHCFVFSDDPEWAKCNFRTDLPTTLVDIHGTTEAHEDLRLMAACKRYVIANSSLSWWGAWLGSRSGKLVVAPHCWFQTSANDTSDLIPPDWLRI